jgi:hypothetical protein
MEWHGVVQSTFYSNQNNIVLTFKLTSPRGNNINNIENESLCMVSVKKNTSHRIKTNQRLEAERLGRDARPETKLQQKVR